MQATKLRPGTRRGGVIWLPADELEPSPVQPRKNFPDGELQELSESIAQYGVLNPLTVRLRDGRYELVRRTDIGLQRNRGLDLDIKDHWNGKVRDVKSLSGGESFMASLALSLALSDETGAEAGGIHIDSMFIDEGFGSLDTESLDNALSVLSSQAGGRSIGIISHVEALKEKIDKKIVVKKGPLTSTAEVKL